MLDPKLDVEKSRQFKDEPQFAPQHRSLSSARNESWERSQDVDSAM
jgi:hypothetical protein